MLLCLCSGFIQPAANAINSVSAHLSRVPEQGAIGTNEFLIRTQWHYRHETEPVIKYGREWYLNCLDPAPAAISLLFCLKEIDPIFIPDHLPETRSIALAAQRFGATKEDLRKIRGYKTKMFADVVSSYSGHIDAGQGKYGSRSEGQEFDFRRILSGQEGIIRVEAPSAMRGKMTGIWEGFYMVSGHCSHPVVLILITLEFIR